MESRFKINAESISLRFPVPISEYLSLGAATVLSSRPIFYYAQLLNKMVAQPNSDTLKLLGKWLIPWRFLVIIQEQFLSGSATLLAGFLTRNLQQCHCKTQFVL